MLKKLFRQLLSVGNFSQKNQWYKVFQSLDDEQAILAFQELKKLGAHWTIFHDIAGYVQSYSVNISVVTPNGLKPIGIAHHVNPDKAVLEIWERVKEHIGKEIRVGLYAQHPYKVTKTEFKPL